MLLLSLCPLVFHLVFDHSLLLHLHNFFPGISESFNTFPLYTPVTSSLPIALLFNVFETIICLVF